MDICELVVNFFGEPICYRSMVKEVGYNEFLDHINSCKKCQTHLRLTYLKKAKATHVFGLMYDIAKINGHSLLQNYKDLYNLSQWMDVMVFNHLNEKGDENE